MINPRFTADEMERANASWGANCGPGSIAAIMGMTLDELRPVMVAEGFEAKHYTNPAMMFAVLRRIGRPWHSIAPNTWPSWGLVRIQWEGPWTAPDVPLRARYRHTHWVGAMSRDRGIGIFDVNAINNGTGWVSLADWARVIVPWILQECVPRADGRWHITHSIKVQPA